MEHKLILRHTPKVPYSVTNQEQQPQFAKKQRQVLKGLSRKLSAANGHPEGQLQSTQARLSALCE
ncbi:hypothetical protein J6590_007891 [Homalodisca vitripennis]|nr:hypothetical protein J6590_007891 [Homalodisca vitripennis]